MVVILVVGVAVVIVAEGVEGVVVVVVVVVGVVVVIAVGVEGLVVFVVEGVAVVVVVEGVVTAVNGVEGVGHPQHLNLIS